MCVPEMAESAALFRHDPNPAMRAFRAAHFTVLVAEAGIRHTVGLPTGVFQTTVSALPYNLFLGC